MKAVTQSLKDIFFIRFLLAATVRKIYIRAGFFNNVTANKIELSPQTVFSFNNYFQRSQHKNKECNHCSSFFSSFLSPRFFYFSFPCSFLGGFLGSFSLRLLVSFSVKRLQFSFGTFSKIQQDNALAFTVTYTLIFVNVPASSNIQVSLFRNFIFFLLK